MIVIKLNNNLTLTRLNSLRIDNNVNQQYPATLFCLHAHINQGLTLCSNILFTAEIWRLIESLLGKLEVIWCSAYTLISSFLVCFDCTDRVRLFPIYLLSSLIREARCIAFHMKITFYSVLDKTFWKRGLKQLGSGLFTYLFIQWNWWPNIERNRIERIERQITSLEVNAVVYMISWNH